MIFPLPHSIDNGLSLINILYFWSIFPLLFLRHSAGSRLFANPMLLCFFLSNFIIFTHQFSLADTGNEVLKKKCLIVSSYHDGFVGQAQKVESAREILEGKCKIKQFNMDTKRNPEPDFCRSRAKDALALIERWRPDVLIAIDDNASKYLVQPYLKDAELPIVFSGLDWTAAEYGYPYSNATGIIEVFPIMQLLKDLINNYPETERAVCIRGMRLSEKKDCDRYIQVSKTLGINVVDRPVATYEEFKETYLKAQKEDFVIFQNYSGIEGWDDDRARQFFLDNTRTLTVSNLEWMAPFVILSYIQIVKEQGEYAANLALKILDGASPSSFPIVANRRWDMLVNLELLKRSGIKLPANILHKAQKVK